MQLTSSTSPRSARRAWIVHVTLAAALCAAGCTQSVEGQGPPAHCENVDAAGTPEASPGSADDADAVAEAPSSEAASPGSSVEAGGEVVASDEVQEAQPGPGDAAGIEGASDAAALEAASDAPDARPAHCFDGIKDGDETDIDCGGSCAGCGPHGFCASNSDCSATAPGCIVPAGGCFCQSLSNECVEDHCEDFRLDGDETGVDCGGSLCLRCANGTACRVDSDCASMACDAITLVCIGDQCADHRLDGMESDVDCGGGTCARCAPGKVCNINIDCQPGYLCLATHVCGL
jgi:hypothetical protein